MKPTERFSDRVAQYVAFRPSYPEALISTLVQECKLHRHSVIADIGSGTGKLTGMLLDCVDLVFGVEPNREMREAAELLFTENNAFRSLAGDSANTGIDTHAVDLITAAQSFHWFSPVETRQEFERILKPGGYVVLIWNQRATDSDFQQAYDQMLTKHCKEYAEVNHRNITDHAIERFFHPHAVREFSFPYSQTFDLAGLIGRMNSSSYTPKEGTREAHVLLEAAGQLFDKHENNGKVDFKYETRLYLSTLEE